MPLGVIAFRGEQVICRLGSDEAQLGGDEALARLADWAARYDVALERERTEPDVSRGLIADIGHEMFAWLDETGWAGRWARASGDRELEIRVDGDAADPREAGLLDAPWEVLANATGPLAQDDLQLFQVRRRIGPAGDVLAPRHEDIQLMFLAASPEDVSPVLDYEGEEAALLQATRGAHRVHLVIEETGALSPLGLRMTSDEGPFEALHISCHGDLDRALGPILVLEDEAGAAAHAKPGDLLAALGAPPPGLVMVSACRTAEAGKGGQASFVRQLTTQVANVVGWDGSVYDHDATHFATVFYEALGHQRATVPRAAALGRRALLRRAQAGQGGRHWHLARVYLGSGGGGPLCSATGTRRVHAEDTTPQVFLDKARQQVPVASRAAFVGRRREIQKVLRTFREAPSAGVLVYGMGALGKSSLAERVRSRLLWPTGVVFGRYDAVSIFDILVDLVEPEERQSHKDRWRARIDNDEAQLADAVESLLTGPLAADPVLLIIDDLERILETPKADGRTTRVKSAYGKSLGAVLKAFARPGVTSRLLITSRYDFTLPDGHGGDLAQPLTRVPLKPMTPREREKQLQAAGRIAGQEGLDDAAWALAARALAAAGGNPGLQEVLIRPILAGELQVAAQALEQIETYLQTGAPPAEIQALIDNGSAKDSANAMVLFFHRLSFAAYQAALTQGEARLLTASTLFQEGVPAPQAAIVAAGAALGCEDPQAAIARLIGLGLLDDHGDIAGHPHAAINSLARPLAGTLDDADIPRLAKAAWPALARAWGNARDNFPIDPRGLEAARLALVAEPEPTELEAAVLAGAVWLERIESRTREALTLIQAALARLPEDHALGPYFVRLAVECADQLSDADLLDALLERPLRVGRSGDPESRLEPARLDLRRAHRLIRRGQIGDAEALIRKALEVFEALDDVRTRAVALGDIAEILYRRGELDEALRIRREEQLPVFDRLGDARSRAVTHGQIADILVQRGELDEALRIRREEQLPVFDRLGDARSRAVTHGQIADILYRRGELDEALRIRREDELPVFDGLGDARSRAITQGRIADILFRRGELDEALRIRREEELPVYDRLGDVRSRAITLGDIADIHFQRGELDEALRIRREDELPVYDRLGDVRARAITQGQIADILFERGELDEALRIRREEQLPVFDRLSDVRSRAVTVGKIADILFERGELDEALRIRREEQLPVYERLGDVRERSVTLHRIATDLLASNGLETGRIQEIYEALAEAFAIALQLKLPDGTAFIGLSLAQVMMIGGLADEALEVLDAVDLAFATLGDAEGAEAAREVRRQIEAAAS